MDDQKYSQETDPGGVLHPESHGNRVPAPPLEDTPKRAPRGTQTVHVDETGCAHVPTPEDPTFKGARY